MKLNRRDYLKQLGAAGVLAGTTGLQGFAHESADPQETCLADPTCPRQTAPLVWQPAWCEPLPPNAESRCVKLIFEGLAGIARRLDSGKMACDVGFHIKGESPIHHQLSIRTHSNVGDSNCRESKTFDEKKFETIRLDFDPELDQTYFYQRGQACTRRALTDEKDFRWIVDFESDYLYRKHLLGEYLDKKDDAYSPVLLVKSGIFYTLLKTGSTFLARSEDDKYFVDMGNVARIIAANVYVKSGGVTLTVDNLTTTVQPPGEIYFTNHCMKGNGDCADFVPDHRNKKLRSDFFLNYKAFGRKGHPEYQLHLLESNKPGIPDVICEKDRYIEMNGKRFNDESPCSAAGYGGKTDGLPSPS